MKYFSNPGAASVLKFLASAVFFVGTAAPIAAETAQPEGWDLLALGDTSMAGSAAQEYASMPVTMPFSGTQALIDNAEIVFLNLETSLTNGGTAADKKYTFRSHPSLAKGMSQAGIDVVTLANNHSMDYGASGLNDTLQNLDNAGIDACGAGTTSAEARTPAIATAGDIRVAFVCYSNTFPESFWAKTAKPGTAFGHAAWVRADVQAALLQADIVVASFHWGSELMETPKDYQVELAHIAIDAGATVVIGHHPHILQGVEIYKNRPILYSIGNYAFGSYSKRVHDSAAFQIHFMGTQPVSVQATPLDVYNPRVVFVPQIHTPAEAERVSENLQKLSGALGTSGSVVNGVWHWNRSQ